MASSTLSHDRRFSHDSEIWESLKEAIAKSSGFERWQEEKGLDAEQQINLDLQVQRYLRETLETLAY